MRWPRTNLEEKQEPRAATSARAKRHAEGMWHDVTRKALTEAAIEKRTLPAALPIKSSRMAPRRASAAASGARRAWAAEAPVSRVLRAPAPAPGDPASGPRETGNLPDRPGRPPGSAAARRPDRPSTARSWAGRPSRPSVVPKKKRKAETAAFMLVAEAPMDRMCS